MTKSQAIQGVLAGTYEAVTSSTYASREYVKLYNGALVKKNSNGYATYTDMNNLSDPTWTVYAYEWFANIPATGMLVISNNAPLTVRRAMTYVTPNVTFDDGTSAAAANYSPLTADEVVTLYKTAQLFI